MTGGDGPVPPQVFFDSFEDERMAEPQELPSGTRCRHLLYIEDNTANVELVRRVVSRHPDIRLTAAGRGDVGLEIAFRDMPDAIIVDLHLPDMGGATVVRALRDDPRTSKLPVIVVTADVTHDHEQTMLAEGATAYLRKPLDLVRFERELERALAHSGAGAPRAG
jgi:CheY-like chemotaxis protein